MDEIEIPLQFSKCLGSLNFLCIGLIMPDLNCSGTLLVLRISLNISTIIGRATLSEYFRCSNLQLVPVHPLLFPNLEILWLEKLLLRL